MLNQIVPVSAGRLLTLYGVIAAQHILAGVVVREYRKQEKLLMRHVHLNRYLLKMVVENELPVDDFDIRALYELGVELKVREI